MLHDLTLIIPVFFNHRPLFYDDVDDNDDDNDNDDINNNDNNNNKYLNNVPGNMKSGRTENSRTEHWPHTSESGNVKVTDTYCHGK